MEANSPIKLDCVEMKDAAQKQVAKAVRGMSPAERIGFLNKKAAALSKKAKGSSKK